MKKTLVFAMAGALFAAGCGTKIEDPCKDPNAVLSKQLIEKCFASSTRQTTGSSALAGVEGLRSDIERFRGDIERLNQRVSAVEANIDQLKKEHEELKSEIYQLRGTTKGKEQVRVYFARDKYTLDGNAQKALNELLNAIKDKDIKRVIVVGYASKPGTRGYNLELSLKRAQVVGAYLVKNGIPVEKIRIAAYGEELAGLLGKAEPEQKAVDVIVFY